MSTAMPAPAPPVSPAPAVAATPASSVRPAGPAGPATALAGVAFEVTPFSTTCASIWDRGEHVLIGVSPGNGYFTHQRIGELVAWADQRFAAIDIVYADLHVDRMFAAFGYTAEHAAKRAAKDVKAVRRRILRGIDEVGAAGLLNAKPRVHALSDFADEPTYRRLHARAIEALHVDDDVRRAGDAMANGFVAPRLPDGAEMTSEQRRTCVDYIAAELPFFVDTPAILGVRSSVSCYHTVLPMTEVLFSRRTAFRAEPDQAYAVVRPTVSHTEGNPA
jgi:cyclo(L-tyrosyl-L-tyrosyl) synthase